MTSPSSYAENANFWKKIIREGLDPYRRELTDAAVIRAVQPGPETRILDAGCGEGYLARQLAAHGATVTGVDACEALVDAAIALDEHDGLEYVTASVDDLPLDDSSVDVVVCNHVLNDLRDIEAPLQEFGRILAPGGRLVALMLHPCFYVPHAERDSVTDVVTPDVYFSERVIEQPFSVSGITSPASVRMWFRPLEDYVSAITAAGLAITDLTEPHPPVELLAPGSWWHENFRRPLFMLITATKLR
jgi:ubiquinone/menaquinone biosynthesis C-methylase UbiE